MSVFLKIILHILSIKYDVLLNYSNESNILKYFSLIRYWHFLSLFGINITRFNTIYNQVDMYKKLR